MGIFQIQTIASLNDKREERRKNETRERKENLPKIPAF
jgi:hypothetical protein